MYGQCVTSRNFSWYCLIIVIIIYLKFWNAIDWLSMELEGFALTYSCHRSSITNIRDPDNSAGFIQYYYHSLETDYSFTQFYKERCTKFFIFNMVNFYGLLTITFNAINYWQTTNNKDDNIHYYSNEHSRTKMWAYLRFYSSQNNKDNHKCCMTYPVKKGKKCLSHTLVWGPRQD